MPQRYWALRCLLLMGVLAFTGIAAASAKTIYVSKAASAATPDGTSWATAYPTVTTGLFNAASGDEVWVAAGTYKERVTMKNGVALYGGFAGTETERVQRDARANVTILDGSRGGSVVMFPLGSNVNTILDGFTVRNGRGTPFMNDHEYGGGVYFNVSTGVVRNCVFTRNEAYNGGGAAAYGGAPTITNNIFFDNYAGGYGAAVLSHGSAATIRDNFMVGNGSYFGVVHLRENTSIKATKPSLVLNNTIIGNTTVGVYVGVTNAVTVANNLIAFNTGDVQLNYNVTAVSVHHNDLYDNEGAENSPFEHFIGQNGNISVDPHIVSRRYAEAHLLPDSPLKDAGDPTVLVDGEMDVDGNPRTIGAGPDIGADEIDGTTYTVGPKAIRVSPTGNDANDGATWATAKKTVQAGIDAAAPSRGEVWVAAGTYNEHVWLGAFTQMYGGFAGTETDRPQRDPKANITVLDGGRNDSVVFTPAGMTYNVVDGFTIRNGAGHNESTALNWPEGGGINAAYSSPTISHNIITGNSVRASGGGISANGHYVVITDNVITGNSTTDEFQGWGGGGIWANTTNGLIARNVITDNTSPLGGGIYSAWIGSTLRDNLIAENRATSATWGGGGLFTRGATALINCTVVNNTAPNNGGAVYAYDDYRSFTGVNDIIAFNSSGVYQDPKASWGAGIFSSDVYGNTAYDLSGATVYALPNVPSQVDPLFVDRAGGDFHLSKDSPLQDAGDDSEVQLDEMDLDGNARRMGAHVDMGAYEVPVAGRLATVADVRKALSMAAGLAPSTPVDVQSLGAVAGDPAVVTLEDAVRLARKLLGPDPNP